MLYDIQHLASNDINSSRGIRGINGITRNVPIVDVPLEVENQPYA